VVGLRHPLLHLRGKAINALRNDGIAVDVLREDVNEGDRFQVRSPPEVVFSLHTEEVIPLAESISGSGLQAIRLTNIEDIEHLVGLWLN
jgi:hypothetical protein